MRILRIKFRTLAYIALILKELSFLCDISFLTIPLWVTAQSVSSARIGAVTSTCLIRAAQCADLTVTAAAPGYSAVLLTVLAVWDASPRKIRAAIAWGIISAARYTHLQAGTLGLGHCLGWQAAGESGVMAWRMLPAQLHQRLDSSPAIASISAFSMRQPRAVHACRAACCPDCPPAQWPPYSLLRSSLTVCLRWPCACVPLLCTPANPCTVVCAWLQVWSSSSCLACRQSRQSSTP